MESSDVLRRLPAQVRQQNASESVEHEPQLSVSVASRLGSSDVVRWHMFLRVGATTSD